MVGRVLTPGSRPASGIQGCALSGEKEAKYPLYTSTRQCGGWAVELQSNRSLALGAILGSGSSAQAGRRCYRPGTGRKHGHPFWVVQLHKHQSAGGNGGRRRVFLCCGACGRVVEPPLGPPRRGPCTAVSNPKRAPSHAHRPPRGTTPHAVLRPLHCHRHSLPAWPLHVGPPQPTCCHATPPFPLPTLPNAVAAVAADCCCC